VQKLISRAVTRVSGDAIQRPWTALAAILLLSLPLLFFCLDGWSFIDPDEGRYGTIPYQMLTRGDFVTPKQNDIKFFDKPPLLYWGIAASYSIFGLQEWAARLVPAMAALMGLLAVYALGRRMFSPRAGTIGAIILATSFMWPLMARVVVTDMLVSALVFVALVLWWMGHSEDSSVFEQRRTGYFIGFWITLSLAVLAKGPIAVVLTGGCIFLYALLCRQWQSLSGMRWAIGTPLFIAITAPWFILVAQRNPEFNHFFWYDQHIGRFLGNTTGNDHVQGAGYYFQLLPLILFPWSVFVPAAVFAGWRNLRGLVSARPSAKPKARASAKQRAIIYLLCGVAFTLLFFSSSSGKLLTYILPVVPLLSLLLAAYFDWLLERRVTWSRGLSVGVVALATILVIGGVATTVLAPQRLRSLGVDGSIATGLGTMLIIWAVVLAASSWRFRLKGLLASTAGGFTVVFVAILLTMAAVMPRFTTESLVQYIRPGLASQPKSEVLTIGYVRSISFYLQRRVKIFGPPEELKFGVEHMPLGERRAWVFDGPSELDNLRAKMGSPYPVYCFAQASKNKRKKVENLIKEVGDGATLIAANERFLVFGNRAALAATPPQPNVTQR
jgi:4-amino-4-deoxy-L-arabinose transferase-like glycosyltransferase